MQALAWYAEQSLAGHSSTRFWLEVLTRTLLCSAGAATVCADVCGECYGNRTFLAARCFTCSGFALLAHSHGLEDITVTWLLTIATRCSAHAQVHDIVVCCNVFCKGRLGQRPFESASRTPLCLGFVFRYTFRALRRVPKATMPIGPLSL